MNERLHELFARARADEVAESPLDLVQRQVDEWVAGRTVG